VSEAMQAMMNNEIERVKKEQKENAKQYERKLQDNHTKIN
jgi:hypothetical protein